MPKKDIEARIKQLCRTSFAHFLRFVGDFPISKMHAEWCHALETSHRVLIMSPRSHGKTTVCSVFYPAWRIGLNPNVRIKIVTNANDKSKEIITAISQIILTSPEYQLIFPHIKPAKMRYWTKEKIYVARDLPLRDATVEGKGIISTGTGGRSDILICDDVSDNRTTATKSMIKKVKEAFYDVWLNTLEPHGNQVVVVGTTWAEDDLLTDLMQNKEWEYRKMWKVNENFDPLWPQVWSRQKLYKKWKEDPLAFEKGFRMQPIRVETALFSEECFKQRKDWPLMPGSNPPDFVSLPESMIRRYMGVDLSSGHGKDFSVIFIIGVHVENLLRWPVEIIRMKAPSPDVARMILKKYEQYKPEVIMIENNAMQSAMQEWLSELRKIPIRPYYTGKQKSYTNIGIPSLRVELDNNMWQIPWWSHDPGCACAYCEWKKELLRYPYSPRDDCVMAMWFAREGVRLFLEGRGRGGYALIEL